MALAEGLAFMQASTEPSLVDLFFDATFVIAGVAATRLILGPGPRGLVEAWATVVRRGLPAVATVLIGVLAVSAAVLPPADLSRQASTALWTALGASGLHLMQQGGPEAAAGDELLLHLWATGVAVQLFAGWTLILAALIRLRLTRWTGAIAGTGLLLSLGLEVWMRGQGMQPQAFYLAPANAWPFLLGALLAGLPPERGVRALPSGSRFRPLGELIWPFVLWLWPLATLPSMILARPLTLAETAAVLAVAMLFSLATWRWIERPARHRLGHNPRNVFAAWVACVLILALIPAAILAAKGLPGRADADLLAEAASIQRRPLLQAACHVDAGQTRPNPDCTTPAGGPAEVVVWGNSHTSHLTPAILDWTARRGLRMRQATKSGCPALLVSGDGLASTECLAFNRAAVAEMGEGTPPRLVILGGAWTVLMARSAADDSQEVERLERDLAATVQRVRTVAGPAAAIVLVGTTPDFDFAPAACHSRRRFLGLDTRRCDLAPPANAAMAAVMDGVLGRVAAGQAGVRVFDPATALCAQGLCRTRSPSGPWYADRHHLTPVGGLAQSQALAAVLDAAWPAP
jgi:peptidoglycan/LPS O-acetylase OafA/YrhL